MKLPRPFLTTLFALLLLLSNNFSQAQIDTTGLIAKWKFSGNAADSSGRNHHGAIVGTITPTTGKQGLPNTAMHFPGAGNYISVPDSPDLNFNKYSICAVLRSTEFYKGPCQGNSIIVRGPSGPGHWGITLNDNAFNDCAIADTNNYVFSAYSGSGSTSGNPVLEQYSPGTHTNTWYCVIATYENSNISIYIDGALKSRYPSAPIGSGSYTTGIGADLFTNSPNFPFTGDIDEIRIYKRVLSSEEITTYCNQNTEDVDTSTVSITNAPDASNNDIALYPNPVQSRLTIDAHNIKGIKQYEVFTQVGQSVISASFSDDTNEIDVAHLPKGIYYIKIKNNDNQTVKQFIIQ